MPVKLHRVAKFRENRFKDDGETWLEKSRRNMMVFLSFTERVTAGLSCPMGPLGPGSRASQ